MMPVEMRGLRITLAKERSDFRSNTVFIRIKYTSNMAACYVSYVSDVTAPRVRHN